MKNFTEIPQTSVWDVERNGQMFSSLTEDGVITTVLGCDRGGKRVQPAYLPHLEIKVPEFLAMLPGPDSSVLVIGVFKIINVLRAKQNTQEQENIREFRKQSLTQPIAESGWERADKDFNR